jgi:hypothetical protein
MCEDLNFYLSLVEIWESASETSKIQKIQEQWSVQALLTYLELKNPISLKGVVALLCYYALQSFVFYDLLF